jgi:hypothetical protein
VFLPTDDRLVSLVNAFHRAGSCTVCRYDAVIVSSVCTRCTMAVHSSTCFSKYYETVPMSWGLHCKHISGERQ